MTFPFSPQAIENAKRRDLVDFLFHLGIQPRFRRGEEYAYISPFREETNPSFMVNRRTNLWKDFGSGEGGTMIDFCMRYYGLDFRGAMERLEGAETERASLPRTPRRPAGIPHRPASSLRIQAVRSLTDGRLIRYLRSREVSLDRAQQYCQELEYTVGHRQYKGIGFANDKGGWEIRSPRWKGGNSPKWVRRFENGSSRLHVFEGFMDFLSFLSDPRWKGQREGNYLVLNSLSFFAKMRVYMELHERVFLYLDRDRAGRRHWQMTAAWADHYRDSSPAYHGFRDLNDWLRGVRA